MTYGDDDVCAPAYVGETEPALWHFSEDPSIQVFRPRATAQSHRDGYWVWAVDARHAPLFWFPRDCPRGTAWCTPRTSPTDRARFFAAAVAVPRIHMIERAWVDAIHACRLFAYRMPAALFERDSEVLGYWLATTEIVPLEVRPVGDLHMLHEAAGIELRVVESIWPWWTQVIRSTLGFSGARLRNCGVPEPEWLRAW